ncbi:MAG TPA: hypothetical protein VFZ58_00715 [Candidatus Saccharimonadales bacterium]
MHHERIGFAKYASRPGMEDTVERMLGYFERMHSHVERGFQKAIDIPDIVQLAYDILMSRGYQIRGLHA